MKIKNQDLLERMYSKILAVLRDPHSTLEQVLDAYKSSPERRQENTDSIEYDNEKQFRRHVIKPAFKESISILLGRSKTQEELWKIAVHSKAFGDRRLWKQAVKDLAKKLK